MVTFKEQESCCDNAFRENAPYWHLYTSGKDMPLLFRNDDEFKFVMNVMARSSFDFPDVWIVSLCSWVIMYTSLPLGRGRVFLLCSRCCDNGLHAE